MDGWVGLARLLVWVWVWPRPWAGPPPCWLSSTCLARSPHRRRRCRRRYGHHRPPLRGRAAQARGLAGGHPVQARRARAQLRGGGARGAGQSRPDGRGGRGGGAAGRGRGARDSRLPLRLPDEGRAARGVRGGEQGAQPAAADLEGAERKRCAPLRACTCCSPSARLPPCPGPPKVNLRMLRAAVEAAEALDAAALRHVFCMEGGKWYGCVSSGGLPPQPSERGWSEGEAPCDSRACRRRHQLLTGGRGSAALPRPHPPHRPPAASTCLRRSRRRTARTTRPSCRPCFTSTCR